MSTIKKPSSPSKPIATRKASPPTTTKVAVKAPSKVAVKKVAAVKPIVKTTLASTKTALIVNKTPVQTPAVKPATPTGAVTAASKQLKEKKIKLVRDSFTIPKPEYLIFDALKSRALVLGQAVKKSELLRAGIKALASMSDAQFTATLKSVPTLKSGRPSK